MIRLFKNHPIDLMNASQLCSRKDAIYLLRVSDIKFKNMEKEGEVKLVANIGNQKLYCPKQISDLMHLANKRRLDEEFGPDGIREKYFKLTGKEMVI